MFVINAILIKQIIISANRIERIDQLNMFVQYMIKKIQKHQKKIDGPSVDNNPTNQNYDVPSGIYKKIIDRLDDTNSKMTSLLGEVMRNISLTQSILGNRPSCCHYNSFHSGNRRDDETTSYGKLSLPTMSPPPPPPPPPPLSLSNLSSVPVMPKFIVSPELLKSVRLKPPDEHPMKIKRPMVQTLS